MRGNELLDKMALIDPAYVEAADAAPKKRKRALLTWGAIAACFCLVAAGALVTAGIGKTPHPAPVISDAGELTPVTIPALSDSGRGFEGYLLYDISALHNGNPWEEGMNIRSMPVYQNGAYDASGAGVPRGLTEAEMRERLNRIAASLTLSIVSTEVMDGTGKDAAPTEIQAETDGGTICVQADGGALYFLPEEGLALPDGYHFTSGETTDEEAEALLSYLIDAYGALLDFEKPCAASWGDYNIYGEFHRRYMVYDAAGGDGESLLNYHFRSVEFLPNDRGKLSAICINDGLACAEKIGDYPIVTAAEATERLLSGHYQTSVPAAFPGEEWIGKVELVYRTGRGEELLLPYYRFYVQLPDTVNQAAEEKGLKNYGVYYVPAIAEAYLTNMPLYDGHYN